MQEKREEICLDGLTLHWPRGCLKTPIFSNASNFYITIFLSILYMYSYCDLFFYFAVIVLFVNLNCLKP